MAQIFKRDLAGPGTHAFVIGVGSYPHAKPGQGARPELRTVSDLPSAADSAKLVADWLLANADTLAAPLASLEILVSDVASTGERYGWTQRHRWTSEEPIGEATSEGTFEAGERWLAELTAKPGETAMFYACGHGAGLATQPVIFLSDLNASKANPWAHHNIGLTASSFRHVDAIKAAFFFADTCREFIPRFELANAQDLSRFVEAPDPFDVGRDKVSLLCAASEAVLAYEGALPGGAVRIGRFTQTLLRGLDGASARWRGGRWSVHPGGLFEDLKLLQRVYRPDWRGQRFEPSWPVTQSEFFPIIMHDRPTLPVVITTDPEDAIAGFDLGICAEGDGKAPWLASREQRGTSAWLAHVQGGLTPLYAVAENPPARHASMFVPNAPNFDQRVMVS